MAESNAVMQPEIIHKIDQILRYFVVNVAAPDLLLLISFFNKMMFMIKLNNPVIEKVIQYDGGSMRVNGLSIGAMLPISRIKIDVNAEDWVFRMKTP